MKAVPPEFDFAAPVPAGGYRWWYLDALSDDGHHGLVIIAFVGSVFSPWYHAARRRHGPDVDPENHCSVNVCLYGDGGRRWCMTERRSGSVARDPGQLRIGPSRLAWRPDGLVIDVDERSAPWGQRVAGRIRVLPNAVTPRPWPLDERERHHWWPYAPSAEVSVRFDRPNISWKGRGYLDGNWGEVPLEAGFRYWQWSRAAHAAETRVRYAAESVDGRERRIDVAFAPDGATRSLTATDGQALPASRWGIPRTHLGESPILATRSLEDGPFYARTLLDTEEGPVVHESLSLERFRTGWVRNLLRFRMPREWRPTPPAAT